MHALPQRAVPAPEQTRGRAVSRPALHPPRPPPAPPALTAAGLGCGKSSRPAGSGTGRSRPPPRRARRGPWTSAGRPCPCPRRARRGSRGTGTAGRRAWGTTGVSVARGPGKGGLWHSEIRAPAPHRPCAPQRRAAPHVPAPVWPHGARAPASGRELRVDAAGRPHPRVPGLGLQTPFCSPGGSVCVYGKLCASSAPGQLGRTAQGSAVRPPEGWLCQRLLPCRSLLGSHSPSAAPQPRVSAPRNTSRLAGSSRPASSDRPRPTLPHGRPRWCGPCPEGPGRKHPKTGGHALPSAGAGRGAALLHRRGFVFKAEVLLSERPPGLRV